MGGNRKQIKNNETRFVRETKRNLDNRSIIYEIRHISLRGASR